MSCSDSSSFGLRLARFSMKPVLPRSFLVNKSILHGRFSLLVNDAVQQLDVRLQRENPSQPGFY